MTLARYQQTQELAIVSPDQQVGLAIEKYNVMVRFVKRAMKKGLDYGPIPGTDGKPVLLKPGAEKILSLFQLSHKLEPIERIEDWTGKNNDGEPFFHYAFRAKIHDRGGNLICEYEGSANSFEKKWRYRDARRKCPKCGAEAINKSKDGSGFYCWSKQGGCGAKFAINDQQITGQEVGRVKNPDIYDLVNTIQAIAQKRAFVGGVKLATSASEFFSEDLEMKDVIDVSDLIDVDFVNLQEISVSDVSASATQPAPPVDIQQRVKDFRLLTGHTPEQAKAIARRVLADSPVADSPKDWNETTYQVFRNAMLLDYAGRWKSIEQAERILKGILAEQPSLSDTLLFQEFAAECELLTEDKHKNSPTSIGGTGITVKGVSID